jgi:uncharacterized protein (TIGR00369 family)
LHNEDWGFETNCFVCEPTNAVGLQVPFFVDPERGVVEAEFNLDAAYSGAPTFVHGGVTLAILDEAQAWATIALGHKFAATAETTTRFVAAVRVGHPYRVEARIVEQTAEVITTAAQVLDQRGKVRAETTATFVVFTDAIARRAIGSELNEQDSTYLRE